VAVSLSENGSEDGSVHVFDVSTGKELPDVVPRVQYPTGGGGLEWNADDTGFYYTRYPQGNERPKEDANFYQQVYFHKLGSPATEDTYVIGREFPRIAENRIATTEDGQYVLVSVANGDGGEFAHYLRSPSGKWVQITQFSDGVVSAQFGLNGMLYLLSVKDAPNRKILALPLSRPMLANAKVIVPDSDLAISQFLATAGRLYVVDVVGGPSQVRVFDLEGKQLGSVMLNPISSVGGLVRLKGDEILFSSQTYLEPEAWYHYDPASGGVRKTALAVTSKVDFNDCEVVREFAKSKDGTEIPINIIRCKGTELNGQNPTLLYGYGGFGISEAPNFDASRRVWLEQRGVYVIANLRGGGEFGEAWHSAGKLTKKQNVFDDFAACAQHLIEKKYTNPSMLAIEGGSNGGLLMGAALTQHPELFRTVVSYVGIYDMLRVELFPNGAFNTTEYGTVKDAEQFKALYAYSPYHHVRDETAYPAVLFLTGDNDGRVDPANSRKMIARLQAATNSGLPILLRTDSNAGHGIGTGLSTRVAQQVDVYAFLFDQLGVKYKPIGLR
jgi:prolyl oligopeptidase